MSTRCQIGVLNEEAEERKDCPKYTALIYVHTDGYPQNMLPMLREFVSWFMDHRGFYDSEYLAARLIQNIANEYDSYIPNERYKVLSIGVSNEFHGDIEYFYEIHPDGSVVPYIVDYDDNGDLMFRELPE